MDFEQLFKKISPEDITDKLLVIFIHQQTVYPDSDHFSKFKETGLFKHKLDIEVPLGARFLKPHNDLPILGVIERPTHHVCVDIAVVFFLWHLNTSFAIITVVNIPHHYPHAPLEQGKIMRLLAWQVGSGGSSADDPW